MTLLQTIQQQCATAITSLYPTQISQIPANDLEVSPATSSKFGHYQFNGAMKLSKYLKIAPRDIANQIRDYLVSNATQLFANIEVAGPGFINFTLSAEFLTDLVNKQLTDPRLGCELSQHKQRVVIDFSSPNIAKEMHVGHLRSTIIGDCIARTLEFTGHDILRLNHVGDWGTQFGMLITFLKREYTDAQIQKLTLTDLVSAYKQAKQIFDQDADFKQQAQQAVVALQQGNQESLAIWQAICAISRTAFEQIYAVLDIKLLERGESFYNPFLPKIITDLENKKLITISDGAKCVYLDGFTSRTGEALPLIVQKSDGGYNYATTDLAALKHRTEQEHGTWLIYVTDAGQSQHFSMVFAAGRLAGYYDPAKVRIDHVPFGLVLRADGKKFQTRAGETEKLIDLLNQAVSTAKNLLLQRDYPDLTPEELDNMAQVLGINAIKYADLANNRTSDYTFSFERMLQFEGNTAAFLSYAYVRVQSIKRKINLDINTLIKTHKITLQTTEEIDLGLHLLRFPDVINNFTQELLPNRLTDYLFNLAEKFHSFFHNCRVEGTTEQNSRLLLCETVALVLAKGFDLLGIRPLAKM